MTESVTSVAVDGVTTITFDNPVARNAITRHMYDELELALDACASDPFVRAVVLRGANGAFAGGTDIRWLTEIGSGTHGAEYEAHMRRVQERLTALDVPIVSVVDGPCIGGGLVFAALSDLVFCTPAARFGSPIARTIGNTLSPTSIARLRDTFGRRHTAELLFTARLFDAEEARSAGFVNDVLDLSELESRVSDVLRAIRACAPLTLRSFREFGRRIDAAATTVEHDDVYEEIYASADFSEGATAFLDKRRPRFEGR